MKIRLVAPILAAALAAGCASQGYSKSDDAAESVRSFRAALATVQEQSAAAIAAMNALLAEAPEPVADRFQAMSGRVDGLLGGEKSARGAYGAMKASGEKRFAAWRQELSGYTNEEMKAASEKRMLAAKEAFDKALVAGEGALGAVATYTTDFADYRKFVGNDLSAAGLQAASDLAGRVRAGNGSTDQAIRAAAPDLDRAVDALATAPAAAK